MSHDQEKKIGTPVGEFVATRTKEHDLNLLQAKITELNAFIKGIKSKHNIGIEMGVTAEGFAAREDTGH